MHDKLCLVCEKMCVGEKDSLQRICYNCS